MLSRTAVSDFSCLFCLSSPSLPLIIDIAMVTTSDAAGDTEGVNGDTENLQNAIAEEQRRQEDDRHRQVGGEVGLITHRSRLIAGHTDEYRNNANRVNAVQISR